MALKNVTHGHSFKGKMTKTYLAWCAMKNRCNNINNQDYSHYGGRGITICSRWLESFENFLEDMGEVPLGYTLDRLEVNDNYYKENCKWASRKTQANNKRNNRIIEYNGLTHTLAEWSELKSIKYDVLLARLDKLNWSVDDALNTPTKRGQRFQKYKIQQI